MESCTIKERSNKNENKYVKFHKSEHVTCIVILISAFINNLFIYYKKV